jgi:hypothetical protein
MSIEWLGDRMQIFDELAEYIIDFHSELLTSAETEAHKWLLFPGHAKEPRELQSDPDAAELTRLGPEELYIHIRDRILQGHGAKLNFNRCPNCDGLCRTPLAKQCRHCFHDWH